jgi:hypothetical protein
MTRATLALCCGLLGCDGRIIGSPADPLGRLDASRRVAGGAASAAGGGAEDLGGGSAAGGAPNVTDVNPFACAADEAPAPQDARRLSRTEYLNALRALFERALGPAETSALLQQLDVDRRVPAPSGVLSSSADAQFTVHHSNEFFAIADGSPPPSSPPPTTTASSAPSSATRPGRACSPPPTA